MPVAFGCLYGDVKLVATSGPRLTSDEMSVPTRTSVTRPRTNDPRSKLVVTALIVSSRAGNTDFDSAREKRGLRANTTGISSTGVDKIKCEHPGQDSARGSAQGRQCSAQKNKQKKSHTTVAVCHDNGQRGGHTIPLIPRT